MKTKNALVIVDVTNDFTDPKGTLYVKNGEKIIDNINKLIDSTLFDFIIMVQETHPQNHLWFASNHEGKKIFEQIEINGNIETLWPDHVVENTWGAEIYPKLKDKLTSLKDGYYIFNKGLNPNAHPYSPFQDPDSGILEFLNEQDISTTIIVGLATDYCIKDTAIDSSKYFKTFVVTDAIEAVNIQSTDGENAINVMKKDCVMVTSDQIIDVLQDNPLENCR